MPCPTSGSTRTRSRSASTARSSRPPPPRSCRWRSATSSSDRARNDGVGDNGHWGPTVSVAALLLGDSRFPAGGHAHSGGVEPAVTAGTVTGLESLEWFLRGRLRTAGLVAGGPGAAPCGGGPG